MSKSLIGATEIRNKLGVSEATFMDLVKNAELPAAKNNEGVFEIMEKDIDAWDKNRGRSVDWYREPEPEKKPEKKAALPPKGRYKKSSRNKK